MKTRRVLTMGVLVAVLGISGCGSMSPQGRDTAIGAGVGAVGGSALTGGSTAGTLGGAAVGGYIGNRYGR